MLLPRFDLHTHAARHKLDLLRGIGVDTAGVTDLSLDLPVGDAAHERAAEIWREEGLAGERVVAISPTSREACKQWGAAKWAVVADRVAEEGVRVLLTHGPGEVEQVRSVVAAMRHEPVWKFGSAGVSIEEMGAFLERCALWIGNDGGSKHIATAAGVPTMTVIRWQIGPVWTDATSPTPQAYIDRPPPGGCDLKCTSCSHRGCLAALEPGDVIDRILAMLAHVPDSRPR